MPKSQANKKSIYSKCIIIVVVVLNVMYTTAALAINLLGYDVSPTLTTCWFAFTGGELLACAGIKIAKTVTAEPVYDESDTDNRSRKEYNDESDI